jgi:hypothetical protein
MEIISRFSFEGFRVGGQGHRRYPLSRSCDGVLGTS